MTVLNGHFGVIIYLKFTGHSSTYIHIFHIKEETFIENTNLLQHLGSEKHKTSRYAGHFKWLKIVHVFHLVYAQAFTEQMIKPLHIYPPYYKYKWAGQSFAQVLHVGAVIQHLWH